MATTFSLQEVSDLIILATTLSENQAKSFGYEALSSYYKAKAAVKVDRDGGYYLEAKIRTPTPKRGW